MVVVGIAMEEAGVGKIMLKRNLQGSSFASHRIFGISKGFPKGAFLKCLDRFAS